jgi:hypothetical protein
MWDREKVIDHMRGEYAKVDIKPELASGSRTHGASGAAPWAEWGMVVDVALNTMEEFEWLLPWRCTPLGSW